MLSSSEPLRNIRGQPKQREGKVKVKVNLRLKLRPKPINRGSRALQQALAAEEAPTPVSSDLTPVKAVVGGKARTDDEPPGACPSKFRSHGAGTYQTQETNPRIYGLSLIHI